jgi:hypothetical protein
MALTFGTSISELTMAADFMDEYALAVEISETGNLAEAKSRPGWPLWEKRRN